MFSSCVFVLLAVGAGIVSISVIGGDPGFGVLAVFIVYVALHQHVATHQPFHTTTAHISRYSFNVSAVAYSYRAAALAALIVAYMLCVTLINRTLSTLDVIEHLGYDAVLAPVPSLW